MFVCFTFKALGDLKAYVSVKTAR